MAREPRSRAGLPQEPLVRVSSSANRSASSLIATLRSQRVIAGAPHRRHAAVGDVAQRRVPIRKPQVLPGARARVGLITHRNASLPSWKNTNLAEIVCKSPRAFDGCCPPEPGSYTGPPWPRYATSVARDRLSVTREATRWRHQAALRSEPAARPDRRRRNAAAGLRVHPLPQGRQGHQSQVIEPARAPAPDPSPDPPTGSDHSLLRFRAVLEAGLAALEARREEINEINVFPVADGDTGDNMVLTLRAVSMNSTVSRPRRRTGRSSASDATRSSPRSPAPPCSAPAAIRA